MKTTIFQLTLLVFVLVACTLNKVQSRCIPASDLQIATIKAGINSTSRGNSIEKLFSVKSNDFENVYMVSGNITGPGIKPGEAIGVWAVSGSPNSPGLTLSVDAFAKNFSPWPDASNTKAAITVAADGVNEVKACVRDALK